MAIWQFKLDLYPSDGISNVLGNIPVQLPNEYLVEYSGLDEDPTTKFWLNYHRNKLNELIAELSKKLPEVEWLKNANDTFSWGHEETNDLMLCFNENNIVESFECRIDIRTIDEDFIELVLEICSSNDFLIADGKGNLRTPNRLELGKLMANSNSLKFVSDPEKFLDDFEQSRYME